MAAIHGGAALHAGDLRAALGEVLHDLQADFAVGDLTATEADGNLDLVAIGKELLRHLGLGENVVLFNGGRQLNFLDGHDTLILTVIALPLGLLVAVLVIIQQLAHRGLCLRLNLGQIQAAFFRQLQCLMRRHDAELLAVLVDQANLSVADFFVNHQFGSDVHAPPYVLELVFQVSNPVEATSRKRTGCYIPSSNIAIHPIHAERKCHDTRQREPHEVRDGQASASNIGIIPRLHKHVNSQNAFPKKVFASLQ